MGGRNVLREGMHEACWSAAGVHEGGHVGVAGRCAVGGWVWMEGICEWQVDVHEGGHA